MAVDLCGKIKSGFDPCGKTPSAPGVEPLFYAYNSDDFVETYDVANPLICTGLTAVAGAKLYKIVGFGDDFTAMYKLVKKVVGGRWQETVMGRITQNSTVQKEWLVNAANGRIKIIPIANDKSTDGAIQLFGAVNGMQLTENSQWDSADEDMQGAIKVEFGPPPKLLEPLPPRAILIKPEGAGAATYATTIAALEALVA